MDKVKFSKISRIITQKSFIEGLSYVLLIQHEIKHLLLTRLTFEKYAEVDESQRKLLKFSIPNEKTWDKLCELIE